MGQLKAGCISQSVRCMPIPDQLLAPPRQQEYAVRIYRKPRPAGDPTKLQEYRKAKHEIEMAMT